MSRMQHFILTLLISLLGALAVAAPGGPQAVIYYSDGVKALKPKLYLSDGTLFSAAQQAAEVPGFSNCSLAASVGSSALTIALKDGAGADASAASPCVIGYRNATLTTGTVTKSSVTAALSVVVSNGSALGCTATSVCTIFVYGIYTGSATVLGVINGDMLYEGAVHSSTAEGGAGAADTINTLYSTAAQTTKPVKYLGRVTITPAASFAWTNAATAIVSGDYPVPKAPTIQTFTSGSGTYTLPTSPKPLYIKVKMVGAGGGGGGSSTTAGFDGGTGGTGGSTTFGTSLLTAAGGVGGAKSVGGAGGAATLNSPAIGIALSGGVGDQGGLNVLADYCTAGSGASSPLGGGGSGGATAGSVAGQAGTTNSGSGGGGGSGSTTYRCGGGGGAGAYIEAIIFAPLATYAYAIGAAGTAGAAGTSGFAGGTGAAGYISVTEYYQ